MDWYIIVNMIYFKLVCILKFKRCWFYRWKVKTGIKNCEILVTQMMLLWQHNHNHDLSKTYNKEALLLVLFDVRIPSIQAWSNMVSSKAWVYLLLTGLFVSIHNPMQVQLGQWSSNHWAIHHRCLQLFGKLAAVLALGTNRLAGVKMAPSKSHITKEFLHFLSVAVSTIAEKHIYFSHQGICTI